MLTGFQGPRTSSPSTEMAHRQSGGYKEEPGVAVAGDHVSVRLFNLMAVTYSAGYDYRVCALLWSAAHATAAIIPFASAIISISSTRNSQAALL